jgi:hypothetical protein
MRKSFIAPFNITVVYTINCGYIDSDPEYILPNYSPGAIISDIPMWFNNPRVELWADEAFTMGWHQPNSEIHWGFIPCGTRVTWERHDWIRGCFILTADEIVLIT